MCGVRRMKNDAWSNKELHQNASKYVEQTKQSKLELEDRGGLIL